MPRRTRSCAVLAFALALLVAGGPRHAERARAATGPDGSSDCDAAFVRPGDWLVRKLTTRCERVAIDRIDYRTHDGFTRIAYVVYPAWYASDPAFPLPLVISPHGRGVPARANLRTWRDLPALGPFVLVCPQGQGRRLTLFSWGYAGQIDDLARMPAIVEDALPWLRIDRRRIYAVGTSMGGQESLLLLAHDPHELSGVAAFDSVADMALRYHDFPTLPCDTRCLRQWHASIGRAMQNLARTEIGGTPEEDPSAYAERSPLHYADTIAESGVPLELWWSSTDRIVTEQRHQSEALLLKLRELNPNAPVEGFNGAWAHSSETRAYYPIALADFGLLPPAFDRPPSELRVFHPHHWP